jgi:hypothetical protein
MTPATESQVKHIFAQGKIAFSGADLEITLLGMAWNKGFKVESMEQLSLKQATAMLNDIEMYNDPDRDRREPSRPRRKP